MARLIALEWDTCEARVAIGRTSGKSVIAEAALAVDLTDLTEPTAEALRARIAEACERHLSQRAATLVAVPRSRAEVRMLQIPPAPATEMPDMVRFQAMRQFASVGEDWPLDYVPLGNPKPDDPTLVIAAAIAPETVERVQKVCEGLDSPPAKIGLRSFASAALMRRAAADPDCRLLVLPMADETEMTVMAGGEVLFLRSVRLPSDDKIGALGREIRRTVAAAENQLGHQELQAVVLAGREDELATTREALQQTLAWRIETLDPFAAVECEGELRQQLPANAGRYAAVLGMLVEAADPSPLNIDFLAPRRRPDPPNRRRAYGIVAAAAALLAAAVVGGVLYRIHTYNRQLTMLAEQSISRDASVEAAIKATAEAAEVDDFVNGSVQWLDELYELSQEFPSTELAIVDQATFSMQTGKREIRLKGYVKDTTVINAMERELTDDRHKVKGTGTVFDERRTEFPWSFEETITILESETEESEDE